MSIMYKFMSWMGIMSMWMMMSSSGMNPIKKVILSVKRRNNNNNGNGMTATQTANLLEA